jgi:DNA-binding transcriptional MerR regulator
MRREVGSGALFSIGQMAKLFDMNIRTLRYYDQIGLLKPETVNEETGYRYYSSAQFERLNTIRYLRALDVPIERIAAFFEGRDVELMRGIFEEQLERVGKKRRELARIERKIRGRIAQIDDAVGGALDSPEVRDVPERRVVRLAESFAPTTDLEPLIRDLGKRSNLNDAIFLGKVGVSVSSEDLKARSFDRLSSVFIVVERADSHVGSVERIAGGPFACIRFRGTHADAARYYAKLVDFIEESGLVLAGDSVETTLIDAGMTSDESRFVTELQIPITLSSEK